ncbi:uncharacterized protein [Miscanthus floridulus]|uniref:uncharacterized protein n=1 Tax=Miscanthus floridulus TaxID=154761 RepID=UPI00345B0597
MYKHAPVQDYDMGAAQEKTTSTGLISRFHLIVNLFIQLTSEALFRVGFRVILLTVVQGVHLIASRVMQTGASLLSFGMFPDMSATKTVVHFFIHKLMVGIFCIIFPANKVIQCCIFAEVIFSVQLFKLCNMKQYPL